MKFAQLRPIADAIAARDLDRASAAIDSALEGETGKSWNRDLRKLQATLADGQPRFSILARKGNSKLPFLAFSALPGAGFCPGAGDCLQFCYSFRAWRYPAAFARQAQNAALMQSDAGRMAIVGAVQAAKPRDGRPIDFRLYVDGDFGDANEVAFWMEVLRHRGWLRAYGYSKSWAQLLAFDRESGRWPSNYQLNLSSGSLHGADMEAEMARLPIARGRFIAVNIGRAVKSSDHANREHQAELRAAFGGKAFTCPGKCGSCTPKGHACGSPRFAGIDVIIAVH